MTIDSGQGWPDNREGEFAWTTTITALSTKFMQTESENFLQADHRQIFRSCSVWRAACWFWQLCCWQRCMCCATIRCASITGTGNGIVILAGPACAGRGTAVLWTSGSGWRICPTLPYTRSVRQKGLSAKTVTEIWRFVRGMRGALCTWISVCGSQFITGEDCRYKSCAAVLRQRGEEE